MESLWRWYAGVYQSTAIFLVLFWDVSLLDGIRPAGVPTWQWRPTAGGSGSMAVAGQTELAISAGVRQHLGPGDGTADLCWRQRALLATLHRAALPYISTSSPPGGVLTTWMVARKILENWLYWLVIDSVSFIFTSTGNCT